MNRPTHTGRKLWLRPGKLYLFGRTAAEGMARPARVPAPYHARLTVDSPSPLSPAQRASSPSRTRPSRASTSPSKSAVCPRAVVYVFLRRAFGTAAC